jgi:hypothetical protein
MKRTLFAQSWTNLEKILYFVRCIPYLVHAPRRCLCAVRVRRKFIRWFSPEFQHV